MNVIYAVYFRPGDFMRRSGLEPLAEAVGAIPIKHGCFWKQWGRLNWRVEAALRRWGQRYYGSEWNYLMPILDEWRIARAVDRPGAVVHFLFAEFAGVRNSRFLRKRGARIVGTFHTSPRRLERICGRMPLEAYDAISVVSKNQIPWFEARGVPPDRLFVTLHGVDTTYFRPDPTRKAHSSDSPPLRGLLVGSTERDHDLAAAIMRALPDGVMTLDVATKPYPHPAYRETPNVRLLPHLDDGALLRAYQAADLLVMPLLDATANNAILEAMACGTPVVTNRTSGASEYVEPAGGWVVEPNTVEAWVETLLTISRHRDTWLAEKRKAARAWAEQLDWQRLVPQYRALYERALRE